MANYYRLYANFLSKFLKPVAGIKVVFDCSDGTVGLVLRPLLHKNKLVSWEFLNALPDGRFPAHGPDPLSSGAKSEAIRKVIKWKADLGVIFDSDGDRSLFIDDKGREMKPDHTARLMIGSLRPRKVVVDTPTGYLVRVRDTKLKYKIIDSPVGGYYLKKIMRERRADLGVEHSGHYYFKNFYFSDSGILSSIMVMNAVSEMKSQGISLSEWRRELPRYYSISERSYRAKEPERALKRITRYFKRKGGKISSGDGVTVRNRNFWINVRRSRTEPLLRLNMEAKSKTVLKKELRNIGHVLQKS